MATTTVSCIKQLGKNVFRNLSVKKNRPNITLIRHFCVKSDLNAVEKDPGTIFFNPEIQQLLRHLTRVDLRKVFRPKQCNLTLEEPEYKFMTSEELEQATESAMKEAERRLQMPPFLKERIDETEIICEEPELRGYCDNKFVFTDISFGIPNEKRLIVAREPNGTLRHANMSERFRMNQIYFPIQGRKLRTPRMFQAEYLKPLLEKKEYEYVLDRACLQFEPDSPEFIEVRDTVFNSLDAYREYGCLRSTRHFGPFVFYLTWSKNIDGLMGDLLSSNRLDEAVSLIKLFQRINPESTIAQADDCSGNNLSLVRAYISSSDCKHKGNLELALQTFEELQHIKEQTEQAVRRAHGASE